MSLTKTYIGSGFVQGSAAAAILIASYNQAAGECIVVFTESYEGPGSSPLASVTDTAGNTYVKQLSGQGFTTGNSTYVNVWVATNCLGNAANVISANYTTTGEFSTVSAYRCAGADITTPVDALLTNSSSGFSTSSAASAPYTTSTAHEAILALMGTEAGYIKADSVDSSFTLDDGETGGSGTGISAVASKLVSSIQTAQVVTFTLHASNPWNVLLISIKEASTPPPPGSHPVVCIMQ